MKWRCSLLFFMVFNGAVFAHQPDQAFFKFTKNDSTLTVVAELPWTVRNALLDFDPKLANATTKSQFELAFMEYLAQNLIITEKSGQALKLLKFEEQRNSGHSHQNIYVLTYQGNQVFDVRNTILFNINENQTNFHKIEWLGASFNTLGIQPNFSIETNGSKSWSFGYWGWWLTAPLWLVILGVVFYKKRHQTSVV